MITLTLISRQNQNWFKSLLFAKSDLSLKYTQYIINDKAKWSVQREYIFIYVYIYMNTLLFVIELKFPRKYFASRFIKKRFSLSNIIVKQWYDYTLSSPLSTCFTLRITRSLISFLSNEFAKFFFLNKKKKKNVRIKNISRSHICAHACIPDDMISRIIATIGSIDFSIWLSINQLLYSSIDCLSTLSLTNLLVRTLKDSW